MMPKSEKSEESLNQSSALSGDLSLEQESFHRTEELEDLHSSYSRYFLHYGIKSAALVMFADEILSILKTGNSDITPVTEKFKILTEPLGISMTPLKTILPVPDRAFSISTSYWGSLGSQEPDRLKILPSDFMSVLGGGIIGRPEVVPSKVLQINWQLRDLRNSAQVGALIKVAHSLWQKCLSKLELPEFAWSRDSAKAAQIQLVSAFFERIVRDPSNAYYLEKGQSFLDSFREPIGGKVGGPADGKSRKSSGSSSVVAPKTIKVDPEPKPIPVKLNAAEPIIAPVSQVKVAPPRESVLPVAPKREVARPAIISPSLSSDQKRLNQMERDELSLRLQSLLDSPKERRVIPRVAKEQVGSWRVSEEPNRTLLEVVLTAYRFDQYLEVDMRNGHRCEGVVVFGAQRHDFFTLIDERNEKTSYPRFEDVRAVRIFNQISDKGSRE